MKNRQRKRNLAPRQAHAAQSFDRRFAAFRARHLAAAFARAAERQCLFVEAFFEAVRAAVRATELKVETHLAFTTGAPLDRDFWRYLGQT